MAKVPIPITVEIHRSMELIEGQYDANGLISGYCTAKYKNLWMYKGEWVEGKRMGQGKLLLASGDYIEGYIDHDRYLKVSGYGWIVYKNGHRYCGQFIDQLRTGKGYERFPDGTEYNGFYENDMKHGHGILTFADESRYEGEFVQDKLEVGRAI